jgi:hypothetical protein
VLFLGFLEVLEEWEKWEILYKKSYKIFIFYRYVRVWAYKSQMDWNLYLWGGSLYGAGPPPSSGNRPLLNLYQVPFFLIQNSGGGEVYG